MQLFLINFSGENNKIKNNKLQKEHSKFFVNYILKEILKCEDILKKDENGKPFLQNSTNKISISHSKNLIAILFDKNDCGVDVEFIKKREFKKILEHFNIQKDFSTIEFYQWWTGYEAEFKSKIRKKILSFIYKNYICSISCFNNRLDDVFEIDYKDKKITTKKYNIEEFLPEIK